MHHEMTLVDTSANSLYNGSHQYNLRSHSGAAVVRFECHAAYKHGMKEEACESEEGDSEADGLDRSVPHGMIVVCFDIQSGQKP
jgi:hypothetical protein